MFGLIRLADSQVCSGPTVNNGALLLVEPAELPWREPAGHKTLIVSIQRADWDTAPLQKIFPPNVVVSLGTFNHIKTLGGHIWYACPPQTSSDAGVVFEFGGEHRPTCLARIFVAACLLDRGESDGGEGKGRRTGTKGEL